MKPHRPFPVTMLAIVVLSLTALNVVRFGASLAQWQVLVEFANLPYTVYIAVTGLIWSVVGVLLLIGIWRGLRMARWGGVTVTLIYVIYFWMDRLLIQKIPANNTPFVLAVQAVFLAFSFLTLVGAKGYFTNSTTS